MLDDMMMVMYSELLRTWKEAAMICLMELPPLFRRVRNIQYSTSVGLYSNPGLNSSGQSGVAVTRRR